MKQDKQLEHTAVVKTVLGEVHVEFDELKKNDTFYLLEPDGKRLPENGWFTAYSDVEQGGIMIQKDSEID